MIGEGAKQNRKRRWLRLSLRTLFVLLTIFCLWLGWRANRAREQHAGVRAIQDAGGVCLYDYEFGVDGNYIANAVPPGPVWLRNLVGVDLLANVVEVRCREKQFTDVTPLAKLKELLRLDLAGSNVHEIAALAKLKNLRWVNLTGTQVSNLSPLEQLTNLDALYAAGTPVKDITPLAKIKKLSTLNLNDTPVSDVVPLASLTSLVNLELRATNITDITPLASLTNLSFLLLRDTKISDVTPLAVLVRLEYLELNGTWLNEEAFKEIQQALPNCKMAWSNTTQP